MGMFDTLMNSDLSILDPNGGVLVCTAYWRPQRGAPDPEQPGEKAFILSYLPTDTEGPCPCGSSERFGACCQPLPYWRPVCPNPGMQGHSLLVYQSATFTDVSWDEVYDFLQEDLRLFCVEDTQKRAFWLYWGDPALESPYGTFCFGDFELKENRTLVITALSDVRMKVLLDLLNPLNLGTPQLQRESAAHQEKISRKLSRVKRQWKSRSHR